MIVDFDPKWLVSLMKQPLEGNGKFTFIGLKVITLRLWRIEDVTPCFMQKVERTLDKAEG